MENRRLRLTPLALLALLALSTGCNRTRMRECNALNTRINAGVARIEALEKERLQRPEGGPTQTAEAMLRASALYAELARDVNDITPSDRELKNLALDYSFALRSAGNAAEATAKGLQNNQREIATTANATYADSIAKQKVAVDKINAYCAR